MIRKTSRRKKIEIIIGVVFACSVFLCMLVNFTKSNVTPIATKTKTPTLIATKTTIPTVSPTVVATNVVILPTKTLVSTIVVESTQPVINTPTVVATTGAIAKCKDGSFWFGEHRKGACSRHGGVESWIGNPSP
jgi:serine/threonine protein kinase, bacterial